MKKYAILIFLFALQFTVTDAQSVYTNESDVFGAKTFNFYGYDYTKLRLADATRIGQDLTKFFPGMSELLLKQFNQKEFEIMFKKGKGNIPFKTTPTDTLNARINFGKIATDGPSKIAPDSIASMVKKYELSEKEGIGSVILLECFNRETKTISAYYVFFDISTRAIIYSKYIESRDGNQYNYMADWKKAALVAMERLLVSVVDDFNTYRKGQKAVK